MAMSVGGRSGIPENVRPVIVEGVRVDASAKSRIFDEPVGIDLTVVKYVEQLATEINLHALRQLERALHIGIPLLEAFAIIGIAANRRIGVLVEPRNDPMHRVS